ncbi:MAG: hypothetical protein CSA55_00500 [Ilumatobacter coccineus]|uniref:Uncharacterized protein n=1 Tax=Ilumatobacter coccineus TaxID=467094 RepID=A0A2G6KG17_9ACTN|nr:MAG: hypothetical protein CSA55_00500 [Ilumatobacter coccineus]
MACGSLSAISTPSAAGTVELGFGPGEWVGTMNYVGSAELGGVSVFYRSAGAFQFTSDGDSTEGVWSLEAVALPEGGQPASATALGLAHGSSLVLDLELESVTARESQTGLEITLGADEIPNPGVGSIRAQSPLCGAISGTWTIPFNGYDLSGNFVANRLGVDRQRAVDWQDLQLDGIFLLEDISSGEPLDLPAIRRYLTKAEAAMNGTVREGPECDAATLRRFNTAAIALGDAMLAALSERVPELSDDELVEMVRFGYRSGAFIHYELSQPFVQQMQQRMLDAIANEDLNAMFYWLSVAIEFGYNDLARSLMDTIEEVRS